MSAATQAKAFDRATDPLLRLLLTPEQFQSLVGYKGDDELRQRIDVLADKCAESVLTTEERAEYEGYIRANNFVATLQARARKLLDNQSGGSCADRHDA